MEDLDRASLSPDERALLRRFAQLLGERLGPDLRAVWLFGSRARGEPPHEDSDVDVLVIVADGSPAGQRPVGRAFDDAAREPDLERITPWFSVHIHDDRWLAGRRQIGSFFIAEVDRDKVQVSCRP
jgi:predicted nucleotidyltransferase